MKSTGKCCSSPRSSSSVDAKGFALDLADDGGVEQVDDVEKRSNRIHVDAFDDGSFGSVGGGKNEIGNLFLASEDGNGQHAGDGANAAIESEFADHQKLIDVIDAQRAVGAEDSEGDGKVETRAFFFQVGGREVDGDLSRRNRIA